MMRPADGPLHYRGGQAGGGRARSWKRISIVIVWHEHVPQHSSGQVMGGHHHGVPAAYRRHRSLPKQFGVGLEGWFKAFTKTASMCSCLSSATKLWAFFRGRRLRQARACWDGQMGASPHTFGSKFLSMALCPIARFFAGWCLTSTSLCRP